MNSGRFSELTLRIGSAAVLGGVVLVLTWYGGLGFRLLVAVAAVLLLREWLTITTGDQGAGGTGDNKAEPTGKFGMIAICWLALLLALALMVANRSQMALYLGLVAIVLLGISGWVAERNIWVGGGFAYAFLPAVTLALIRQMDAGLSMIVLIFVIVWATDIGAYFAGKAIGGPKLMPSVSPKKTWSGFFGGVVAAVAGCLLAVNYVVPVAIEIPVVAIVIVSIISQIGDLFESWIKRRFGVKDSGNLIPGHGGIMDRADGLVFTAIAVYLLVIIVV